MVEAVSATMLSQPMFNLTVDTAHTFFVGEGQWLVHNNICATQVPYGSTDLSQRAMKYRTDNDITGAGNVAVYEYEVGCCMVFIERTFSGLEEVTYSFEYGDTAESRKRGMDGLKSAVKELFNE